jgi:hypothetical protein
MKPPASWLTVFFVAFAVLSPLSSIYAQTVDYFGGFGSFEASNANDVLVFNGTNRSTSIPGWEMFRGGSFPPVPEWLSNGQAQDGERYILLKARGGSSSAFTGAEFDFSLSPVGITPGELYELTFWAAGGLATSSVNLLQVRVSNSTRIDFEEPYILPVAVQTDVLDWRAYSMTFIPNNANVTLNLMASENAGGTSSLYVDNLSLRVIPEPGSVFLIGVAAGLWGMRRCRGRGLRAWVAWLS